MMNFALITEILKASEETLYMVFLSGFLAAAFGLPLGVLLFAAKKEGLTPMPIFQKLLAAVINALRSVPFIILLIALIPLTRLIAGTSIGTQAAIVPLTIAALPFMARVVENALSETPYGLIEAGLSMGAAWFQIIYYILLREAMPAIIQGIALMLISLVGYAAMAGTIGGGGLGDLAIRYGYQRFDFHIMIITVILLVIIVQIIQYFGDRCAKYFDRR